MKISNDPFSGAKRYRYVLTIERQEACYFYVDVEPDLTGESDVEYAPEEETHSAMVENHHMIYGREVDGFRGNYDEAITLVEE